MSDTKRYPTRMHEVLGVEVNEVFEYLQRGLFYYADCSGFIRECPSGESPHRKNNYAPSRVICNMVNFPDGIIRKPALTEEQVRMLQALHTLGYRYITKDLEGYVCARDIKPEKFEEIWSANGASRVTTLYEDMEQGHLHTLVSWSDPAPLDIAQTLRDAGKEVEG